MENSISIFSPNCTASSPNKSVKMWLPARLSLARPGWHERFQHTRGRLLLFRSDPSLGLLTPPHVYSVFRM